MNNNYSFPRPRTHRKLLWIIIVIVMLLAAGATWFYLRTAAKKSPKTAITTSQSASPAATTKPAAPAAPNAATVLDALTKDKTLTAKYPKLKFAVTSNQPAPAFQVSGDNFYTVGDFGLSFAVQNPSAIGTSNSVATQLTNDMITAATSIFASNQLVKNTTMSSATTDYYSNATTVCETTNAGSSAYIGCADQSAYQSTATTLQPIATAYYKANPDQSQLVFSLNKTGAGANGYSYADAQASNLNGPSNGNGSEILLYEYQGQWTFWRDVQGTLPCNYYNSSALQNAFTGYACMTTDGSNSTVTAPKN